MDRQMGQPLGLEPELGGQLRQSTPRSGYEPDLGGAHRQRGVYVDEITCIGCKTLCPCGAKYVLHRAELRAIAGGAPRWRSD